MARLKAQPILTLEIALVLNETEARALEAVAGYGPSTFLKLFYQYMGRAYLEPHEGGIHSLFASIGDQVPGILKRMDEARALFNGKAAALRSAVEASTRASGEQSEMETRPAQDGSTQKGL